MEPAALPWKSMPAYIQHDESAARDTEHSHSSPIGQLDSAMSENVISLQDVRQMKVR
jgi:hypothetical protein